MNSIPSIKIKSAEYSCDTLFENTETATRIPACKLQCQSEDGDTVLTNVCIHIFCSPVYEIVSVYSMGFAVSQYF